MKGTVSRLAGVVSVVAFVGLLTFILYMQVRNEPNAVDVQYPLATVSPQDIPETSGHAPEVTIVDLDLSVSVDCAGAVLGLRLETKDPLPKNATIRVVTQEAPTTDGNGNQRWKGLGTDSYNAEGGSRHVRLAFSSSLRADLDGEADSVIVSVAYPEAGGLIATSPERIAAADLTC